MQRYKKLLLFATSLVLPAMSFAAATPATDKPATYNTTLLMLIGIICILLFVIGMLAYTLRQLSFSVKEKIRKERNSIADKAKAALLLLFLAASPKLFAEETAAAAPAAPAHAAPIVAGISNFDFYMLAGVITLELLIIFALSAHMITLLKIIRNVPQAEAQTRAVAKTSSFWDKFHNAASLEKEHDILLDHNYDGIQELDNSLPPWWKYGFYLTILVSFIYIYRYHVSHDGASQLDEYAAEMQQGEEEKAKYLSSAANNIDESNVTLLTVAEEISKGKEIFIKSCAPCHLADGGGSVGPNLTDEYWLHGGSLKDVFKSIKYGWQDKGMKSWKDDFSPKELQELASFVKSLKNSHPATPKAPQGEIYIEAGSSGPKSDSSTKNATASIK